MGEGALYAPSSLDFCLLLKIILRHPYLKILYLANLFVADAPMKKNEHFAIWVWKPPMGKSIKIDIGYYFFSYKPQNPLKTIIGRQRDRPGFGVVIKNQKLVAAWNPAAERRSELEFCWALVWLSLQHGFLVRWFMDYYSRTHYSQ